MPPARLHENALKCCKVAQRPGPHHHGRKFFSKMPMRRVWLLSDAMLRSIYMTGDAELSRQGVLRATAHDLTGEIFRDIA
jgi:hypothetical protein